MLHIDTEIFMLNNKDFVDEKYEEDDNQNNLILTFNSIWRNTIYFFMTITIFFKNILNSKKER
jgi:hypothetical protein